MRLEFPTASFDCNDRERCGNVKLFTRDKNFFVIIKKSIRLCVAREHSTAASIAATRDDRARKNEEKKFKVVKHRREWERKFAEDAVGDS